MMNVRDFSRLRDGIFDVCVVGAGIYGAAVAQALASAGLKTALLDKGDFGSATSANSLKILHGGLRYLQHGNIVRMRETIRARRAFMRFAPHLTRPLPCAVPARGWGMRSPLAMRCASLLNNCISFDRNWGLEKDLTLPPGRAAKPHDFLREFPGMPFAGVRGALLWYDALALNTERLVLEYLLAAKECGAEVVNYLRAERILEANGKVNGVHVRDMLGKESFALKARVVVNAAGPWFNTLLIASGIAAPPVRWAKAVNIAVTKPWVGAWAGGVESAENYRDSDAILKRNKRFYFFVPWRGGTLIGTTYHEWRGDKEQFPATKEDVLEIVDEVNAIYPTWGISPQDVGFCHAGLLPMAGKSGPAEAEAPVQLAKNSLIINHYQKGGPAGLLSLRSIKYTTAPVEAEKVARIILRDLGRTPASCRAPKRPGPALPPEQEAFLQTRYGARAAQVAPWLSGENALPLAGDKNILAGEISYFIHEEMALTLADVVFRRTGLGSLKKPRQGLLQALAARMAAELHWDDARKMREIAAVEKRYAMLPGEASS